MEPDIEQGYFTFQSPWRNIFLWNLMEVEREALIITPVMDLDLLRKVQSILIGRSQKKLSIRFLVRFSEMDIIESGIEPEALKILMLLTKEPQSRVELRFAGNLSLTAAIFDRRKAAIATGDMSFRSMVRSVNYGMLVTGNDMVLGVLEDMEKVWEASAEVDQQKVFEYIALLKERISLRNLALNEGMDKELHFDPLRTIAIAPDIPVMGSDRKEPHLDEEKKIVKELLMRAKDAVEEGNQDTALFYLEEALTLKPDSSELLLEKGKILFDRSRDVPAALECIEKVLASDGENRDAWTYRGKCYQESGDIEEALYSYDQSTDIDPQHYPVWILKGAILGKTKGREEDGLKCLEFALGHDPYNEEAWFNKAQVLEQRLNRMEEAVLAYRTLLRINPQHVKGAFRLGLISYKKLKDIKKARKYFDQVVGVDPSHVHAWMFKSEIAQSVDGDIDEALRCLDKAREQKSDSIEVLRREIDILMAGNIRFQDAYGLAKTLTEVSPNDPIGLTVCGLGAYRVDSDPTRALGLLNDAIKADPDNLGAIRAKAMVLSEGLNRPDDALTTLDLALKRHPKDPGLLTERGILYFDHLYDPIEAHANFDAAVMLSPEDADCWYRKGLVLTRGLEKHQDALNALDRATKLNDGHHMAWYEKGRILKTEYSMRSEAVKCYRKSISIHNREPEVFTALAQALSEEGGSDEAVRLFRVALKLDLSNIDASFGLTDELILQDDCEGAQQRLNQVLQTDPRNDRIWVKKAEAFKCSGESVKALECLKRALTINPGNPDAQTMKASIDNA